MSVPSRSERILNLPPYLFADLDRTKRELRSRGVDVIDLSIGDPDLPTPALLIEKLYEAAKKPEHHRYPAYDGSPAFRKVVADWYQDRFGVSLNPENEVLALIGSKEGIAHIPLAFVNPGDLTLVPDPGYPVYATATSFAGGTPRSVPLLKANQFRPKFSEIPADVAKRSKLFFLNYPNNPTSATAGVGFFEEAVAFAKRYEMLICHDAAYTEVFLSGVEPQSFLQAAGAKDVGIEFHSLSKTFNMTGWRVGFAVGNREAIGALAKVKTNVDSGVFGAIQETAISALQHWKELRDQNNRIYGHRRDILLEGLKRLKIPFQIPRATFYVWCDIPTKESSTAFCTRILQKAGVCFTPGVGFGAHGEGYFRITLTASEVRLQEALSRLEKNL
ncbi:MAG TPA: LL-diaminopimelate aminotransferase [Bdellovibrionota bacterium]|nr:LL-diaminopimelate aminotransferase [Bdellovibrionota bacterium]